MLAKPEHDPDQVGKNRDKHKVPQYGNNQRCQAFSGWKTDPDMTPGGTNG
jgi:hypothetical protein